MKQLQLIPIKADGSVPEFDGRQTELIKAVCQATAELYSKLGFDPPWLGYLVIGDADSVLGTCGFKGPPSEGQVEIAYFTFPENEGRGIGTDMAKALVELANSTDPDLLVTAQTLVDRNASHRILEKAGFEPQGTMNHPEDGMVLNWHLV